ncbi:hypothetical protein [Sorangium sp. So ce861]|uniref:hypothetical protein n=1 Tax=Sorangium sp. So ce861 TaxID=3133323 RepID=UPI003F62FEA5
MLALATAARPWSFDGDGAAFQLTARRVLIVAPGGLVEHWRDECPAAWDPRSDTRVPVWEALHQLIRALRGEGDSGAGRLLAAVQPKSEEIRQLAYRLYTLCERRGEAERARAYNELITS